MLSNKTFWQKNEIEKISKAFGMTYFDKSKKLDQIKGTMDFKYLNSVYFFKELYNAAIQKTEDKTIFICDSICKKRMSKIEAFFTRRTPDSFNSFNSFVSISYNKPFMPICSIFNTNINPFFKENAETIYARYGRNNVIFNENFYIIINERFKDLGIKLIHNNNNKIKESLACIFKEFKINRIISFGTELRLFTNECIGPSKRIKLINLTDNLGKAFMECFSQIQSQCIPIEDKVLIEEIKKSMFIPSPFSKLV